MVLYDQGTILHIYYPNHPRSRCILCLPLQRLLTRNKANNARLYIATQASFLVKSTVNLVRGSIILKIFVQNHVNCILVKCIPVAADLSLVSEIDTFSHLQQFHLHYCYEL